MKVPAFKSSGPKNNIDYFTWAGANELASRIRKVWAECGHEVVPIVQKMEGQDGYVVRLPTLVGGLPVSGT